ncbi:hypothetical protein LQZ18_06850 [Lachnospiraceae bacterium ZAX-1]
MIHANYDVVLANKDATIARRCKWFSYMRIGTDKMFDRLWDLLDLAKIEHKEFHKKRICIVNKLGFLAKPQVNMVIY